MKPRHVPIRTCAGCREERPKREMARIVRTPDGRVLVDATGKLSGRGTYICPRVECWEKAMRRGSLDRTLKVTITKEDREELDRARLAVAATATE